jgi:AcrR family transcriptional regulator
MSGAGAATEAAKTAGLSSAGDGYAHRQMLQVQRARILAATVKATCELGVANLTVANIVERAGVSRRTFYELFADCEDCLQAALEEALERACERVLPAYESARGAWRVPIRAGLVALLGFFDEHPDMARLMLVESLAAGPDVLKRRGEVLELVAKALEGGRMARTDGSSAALELAAEGAVGAVASVLHARLVRPHPPGALIELTNPLMGILVLPFLGAAAARKELTQAPLETHVEETQQRTPEDLLTEVNMRLTYRTMRVLAAVATHPGSSNRIVGRAAGISDQGQISKLLMRLCKLGLLENDGVTTAKGKPNAWKLTGKGQRVERALRI